MSKNVNSGEDFESLVAYTYAILSENEEYTRIEGPRVFIESPDGRREFDLVIHSRAAGMPIFTVLECRDLSRPLDIRHIDGFKSKIDDVNANKGVIISRRGFSKAALKKAKRLGISTFTFDSAFTNPNLLERCGYLPVFYAEIDEVEFNSKFLLGSQVRGPVSMLAVDKFMRRLETDIGQEETWSQAFNQFYNNKIPNFSDVLKDAIVKSKIKIKIDLSGNWKRFDLECPNLGLKILRSIYPGIELRITEPHLTYRFNNVSCYFGDPFLREGSMALFENSGDSSLTYVTSVIDPRIGKNHIREFLEPVDGEPSNLQSRNYLRLIRTRIDEWRRLDFNRSLRNYLLIFASS